MRSGVSWWTRNRIEKWLDNNLWYGEKLFDGMVIGNLTPNYHQLFANFYDPEVFLSNSKSIVVHERPLPLWSIATRESGQNTSYTAPGFLEQKGRMPKESDAIYLNMGLFCKERDRTIIFNGWQLIFQFGLKLEVLD